jgi:uncharacterized protein YdhG (YjbR/CyaY superfamily)
MVRPQTISEYIAQFPRGTQTKLRAMHVAIRASAPNSTQGLKWGMPSYSHKRILVNFAGFRSHIGFYPTPAALSAFAKQLVKYKTGKGSIQFPLDKPLPTALISKITKYRVSEEEQGKKWKPKKC